MNERKPTKVDGLDTDGIKDCYSKVLVCVGMRSCAISLKREVFGVISNS